MGRLTTLEALAPIATDGDAIYLGGMTLYRRPIALLRALLVGGARRLTLLSFTSGYEGDLLVGAGRVAAVRTCYFGLETFGLAPMYTRAATSGDVRVMLETEATLAQGFRAALAHTGFMPARALLGTDFLKARPDLKTVTCPYTGLVVLAVPSLAPDVALIHATLADAEGNACLEGNHALDREAAMLAKRTIISAERIVPTSALPRGRVDVPADAVADVIEAPRGAWPTSCFPDYGVDGLEILKYITHAGTGSFDAYLEAFMRGESALTTLGPPPGLDLGPAATS